jgi:hypothetical protein
MTGLQSVLLVDADGERRLARAVELRARGITVIGVASVPEIVRWPSGVVVTAQSHSPLWWKHVGARHVVVLADTLESGQAACAQGADAWLPRMCDVDDLVRVIRRLNERSPHAVE